VEAKAGVTPGFQSFSQNRPISIPPIRRAGPPQRAQGRQQRCAQLLRQPEQDRLRHLGQGSLYYTLSPATRVGGEVSYNTFGSYNEFRSMVGIRQALGAPNEACLQQFGPQLALVDDMPMLNDPTDRGMA
jgi:hypothetical protein